MSEHLSTQTLQRLPLYLRLLQQKQGEGQSHIASNAIAGALGLVEIQVRKDLASVSSGGKPRVGYCVDELIADIGHALGYDNSNDAVLVGAGNLGKALLSYEGFQSYGLNIVAAFDANVGAAGETVNGKPVLPMEKLPDLCRRMQVHIGIITVPAAYAQDVCDKLVGSGVIAVWNFAPAHLSVPEGILVKSENMAASLAQLSRHLREAMHIEE